MINDDIYILWDEFINKSIYTIYFINNDNNNIEKWKKYLELLKLYIDEHN